MPRKIFSSTSLEVHGYGLERPSTRDALAEHQDRYAVEVLSPTPLTGSVDFVTYDPRRSSKPNYIEVGLPSDTYARGGTFSGLLPVLGVGAAWFLGGIAAGVVVHRVRAALV